MADQAGTDPARAEPGTRGRLVVADRVVEKVASIAAGEVDGVVASGSGLGGLLKHRYPRADATVAGDRARVHVEVAVSWPLPLAQVTAAVRQRVGLRLDELVGLAVDAVDVTAATVVTSSALPARSVR